ncbi:rhodanese-like domain-containing protein [Brumimicrobium aurantiacum]|uniref:Rhodanese-like domain-containing protein n=1 Tax=Brumimicrobium aurantiacum TaxID=1737063 RepID=A0A3E1F265_9FLAO|nr:rhodanese-like domain-containing protein [Brumimicrobium aurantiacum]RFC55904.1 rhodanese-like domain-containing protein [Brumimicrobium aurantiacum]
MDKNRKIIDVRSEMEFMGGHVAGSINIPLQEVPDRIEEFRAMDNPILCCASGNRSGQAEQYLKANGIECENGGGWMEVNNKLAQNS